VTARIEEKTGSDSLAHFPRELLQSSGFLLGVVGSAAKARWMEEIEDTGFNPNHVRILMLLDEGASKTQAAIADSLELDRSQLVGLLDKLEEAGLVERRPNPTDRRNHMVMLTSAGRRKLTKFRAAAEAIEEEFLAPLDQQSRVQLHDLLIRLAAAHDPRCTVEQ
jgi:MarR family transcriptional regulator, lower aerobic nicotinate degradation pathway regulator